MQTIKATDLKTAAILTALGVIAAANGGYLDPKKIVKAAKNRKSPLHDEFEWDDDHAAEQYRLAQAGALVRRVKFAVVKESAEDKELIITTSRVYQSRESARVGEVKGYERTSDIMQDQEKRSELINQVLRELGAYRKRYADLIALSPVWGAIDDAIDEISEVPTRQGKAGQASRGASSHPA